MQVHRAKKPTVQTLNFVSRTRCRRDVDMGSPDGGSAFRKNDISHIHHYSVYIVGELGETPTFLQYLNIGKPARTFPLSLRARFPGREASRRAS